MGLDALIFAKPNLDSHITNIVDYRIGKLKETDEDSQIDFAALDNVFGRYKMGKATTGDLLKGLEDSLGEDPIIDILKKI